MVPLNKFSAALLLPMFLGGCTQFGDQFTCGNEDSVSATLDLIKEGMEKAAAERSKDENGTSLASNSSIRASLSQIRSR